MQGSKHIKKDTETEAGRTLLIALILILFFLFLAWATWCFFDWKIKVVERSPLTISQPATACIS